MLKTGRWIWNICWKGRGEGDRAVARIGLFAGECLHLGNEGVEMN